MPLNIFMILLFVCVCYMRLIVFVLVCSCVCFFFTNEKLVSDFKHSKSFRGTFITSRVPTVLQLVLVSLCFMASAYSYSVHYPFGTNRCASNLVRPICYLFCCWWFVFVVQLLVKLFGTLSLYRAIVILSILWGSSIDQIYLFSSVCTNLNRLDP